MALADLLGGGPKKKSRNGSASSQHGEKKDDKAASHKSDKDSDGTLLLDELPERPEGCPANAILSATGLWCIPDGRKCRLCPRCDGETIHPGKRRASFAACFGLTILDHRLRQAAGTAVIVLRCISQFTNRVVCSCSCNHIVGE